MLIEDFGIDIHDFSELLATALNHAETEWEKTFLKDLSTRFQRYGDKIFLTEKGMIKLKEISKMS